MSSHHFVKEGQEPALLILEALPFELVGPLLEWAPLVVVADTALSEILKWGIKVDAVLVCEDGVEEMKAKVVDQSPVEIVSYSDSENLLATAFHYLIRKNQKAVNLAAVTSDEFFYTVQDLHQHLHVVVIDPHINWLGIANGRYEKWLPAKTQLLIRKKDAQVIHCKGATELPHYWETTTDGLVKIGSDRFFWVGESHK